MAFLMDRQTFADLEIFEAKEVKKTVLKIFDRVISHGGKEELLDMFHYPLSDFQKIRERQEVIRYVHSEKLSFSIDRYLLDFIEHYLFLSNKPVKVSRFNAWHKYLKYQLQPTNEYYIIQRGIQYVIEFLQELYSSVTEKSEQKLPDWLEQQFSFIAESIRDTELKRIIGFNTKKKIDAMNRERFDYIFRFCEHDRLKKILQTLYQIDAFQAVADITTETEFVFPEITEEKTIEIVGLYHPFVKDAVVNNIRLHENENMLFVTGANMAGKSTFLKAFGVAVYLAHLGFPVPAASMRTGVFNGLFSTINIADNINKGYSHFYTEVLRVKSVAEEINRTGNLVVIFDELFRGTNVKDAYDASLAIISAFSGVKGSVFLVSTHIMEVADKLRCSKNIRFGYFHTTISGKAPVYSYQLHEGVTEERLGMLIIENEEIVEIINAASQTKK
jgi:DNA mismatch repair ATPase MutS